jgi:hypothetical protein
MAITTAVVDDLSMATVDALVDIAAERLGPAVNQVAYDPGLFCRQQRR